MLSFSLAVFFLVLALLSFAIAWRRVPAGWLTALMGSLGAVVIALHEALGDMMPELKMLMPAEYRPWMMVAFLLLTVAARFRNRSARQ